jgi:4-amino-4-deoxy-L-arabinose transferase-like glycosyltransferase
VTLGRRAASIGLAALLGLLTLLRLWWCSRIELSPDEAYYVLWSQRLDWAYFSKGPGVALVIRATTSLLGMSELGVRVASPLLATGATLLLMALVRRTHGAAVALGTGLVMQALPIVNVGALVMTIDPLSIFFWCATLLFAWYAAATPRTSTWLLLGAASGAGLLCKYTNALALIGVTLALLLRADRRRLVAGLGLAWLIFVGCATPPLLWNRAHGWPTARHLAERGGLESGALLQPRETLEFLVVHFGTWSPLVFLAILLALPAAWRRAREHEGTRFLLVASAPILVMYAVLALHEAGEANWTAPGILGLLPLAVACWLPRLGASRGVRAFAVAALVVATLLSLAIADTDLLRAAGIPLRAKQDPSTRLRGWPETAEAVRAARERFEAQRGERVPLVANHYGLASELAFYGAFEPMAPDHPPVYVPATPLPKNQLWFWPGYLDLRPTHPDAALFVTDRKTPPPDGFARSCTLLEELPIERDGDVLRKIRAYACEGLPLPR